jgi:hypothetical protein
MYDHLISTKILSLTMNKYSMNSINDEESCYTLDVDLLTISY